jgi:hypothetical protein
LTFPQDCLNLLLQLPTKSHQVLEVSHPKKAGQFILLASFPVSDHKISDFSAYILTGELMNRTWLLYPRPVCLTKT